MKRASRRAVLRDAAFYGGAAVALAAVWLFVRAVRAGALATPVAWKPWVYAGGLATMWIAVAAARGFKRMGFFVGEGRREKIVAIIINLTAFAAVAAGYVTAIFNIPPEIDSAIKLALAMAATASGAIAIRVAVF